MRSKRKCFLLKYSVFIVEKPVIKKKVQREVLPSNYHCSLPLTRIDLSMYDIDLPPMSTSVNTAPMDVEPTVTCKSIHSHEFYTIIIAFSITDFFNSIRTNKCIK